MTKQEFTTYVAEKNDLSQQQAAEIIDTIFTGITEVMLNKDSLNITGFGIFTAKERAARKGRNPSTGEEIDIAASNAATFKASSKLKAKLNP